MEVTERSQSSQEEEKEGDDDIVGRMEIDDAGDMTEVAGILLRLNVHPPPPLFRVKCLTFLITSPPRTLNP
jgi:hypothetical protein